MNFVANIIRRWYPTEADTTLTMILFTDIYLRLKNRNKIRAIKFSPDKRLICVQYDESAVVSFD